jgi:hypothetical protein
MSEVGRPLILLGVLLVVVGVLLTAGGALGLGRLPGDITWRSRNVVVFAPFGSMLLLSLVLTLVLNLLARR